MASDVFVNGKGWLPRAPESRPKPARYDMFLPVLLDKFQDGRAFTVQDAAGVLWDDLRAKGWPLVKSMKSLRINAQLILNHAARERVILKTKIPYEDTNIRQNVFLVKKSGGTTKE